LTKNWRKKNKNIGVKNWCKKRKAFGVQKQNVGVENFVVKNVKCEIKNFWFNKIQKFWPIFCSEIIFLFVYIFCL